MEIIIHDLPGEKFKKIYKNTDNTLIITNNKKIKNKEMHHTVRYKKKFYFDVYFYGENISDEEKKIAKNIVKANCINLNVDNFNVSFLETIN